MDFEEKEQKELSNKRDIKVLEKRKKYDMLEEEFRKFKFQKVASKSKKKEENVCNKIQEKVSQKERKLKEVTIEKESNHYKIQGVKPIDAVYHPLVGEYKLKLGYKTDGTCQSSSKSSILFQDPNGGEA